MFNALFRRLNGWRPISELNGKSLGIAPRSGADFWLSDGKADWLFRWRPAIGPKTAASIAASRGGYREPRWWKSNTSDRQPDVFMHD